MSRNFENEEWFRRMRGGGARRNDEGSDSFFDSLEYFEDTRDEFGNYSGKNARRESSFEQKNCTAPSFSSSAAPSSYSDAKHGDIMIFRPREVMQVERIIIHLRNGESAVVNLNETNPKSSQIILDYLNGAIFALGGNVHRITENVFVYSPNRKIKT